MKESRTERLFTTLLFRLTDVFTGRRMLQLQARRPMLYWAMFLPPLIFFITAFFAGLAWWNGDLRF